MAGIGFADDPVRYWRAVGVDDARTVQRLLGAGADPNQKNSDGQPALFVALREGNFGVVEALLADPRLNVDTPTAADETGLMMAALRGQLEWAQKLVARGAAVNRAGWTPLHYAASDAGTPVVAWLLAQGAALDARSPTGNTALMMAARYGASESVELLLAKGADPRPRNARGLSAADLARGAGRDRLADQIEAAERAAR
jgi:uncharacterized protein